MRRYIRIYLIPNPYTRRSNVYIRTLANKLNLFKNIQIINNNRLPDIFKLMLADVIHIHWPEIRIGINRFNNSFYGLLNKIIRFILLVVSIRILKSLNKAVILTNHNILPHNKDLTTIDFILLYVLFKLSDKIIVLNTFSKKIQCLIYGRDICRKTRIIRHHHFNEEYGEKIDKKRAKELLGIPNQKFIVVIVGTITEYKAPELLIDIVSGVCRKTNNVLFVIVGIQKKEFIDKIYSKIRKRDCIYIINKFVSDRILSIILSAANLAIVTYKTVWSSGTLHTYISYKIPILVSSLAPIIEEVNNIPEFFFINDPHDAINKILKLSNNSILYSKLINEYNKALEKILKLKDPLAIAIEHIKLYYSVLSGKNKIKDNYSR